MDRVRTESPYRRRNSPYQLGTQRWAQSQSALLPPALSPCVGTPVCLNPFSLRHDLNGGSKLRGPPRQCQSLPCTPDLGRPLTSFNELETESMEEKYEEKEDTEKVVNGSDDLGQDSGLVLDLERVSLERVDEEDEVEEDETEGEMEGLCRVEPMDCNSSPDAAEGALKSTAKPFLHGFYSSSSSVSPQPNGWTVPISSGPPSLPPLPCLDKNNSMLGVGRVPSVRLSGYRGHRAPVRLAPPPEQDDIIICPVCCLVGFSFPSMCLRGAQPPRRTPILRPYRNLNEAQT
ncbi:dual specificity testis-specific protein kinase 2 [Tachysurus ichikawai]